MTGNTETEKPARLYLRLRPETRDRLERLAEEQRRSLQGQAEFFIEEGIRAQESALD